MPPSPTPLSPGHQKQQEETVLHEITHMVESAGAAGIHEYQENIGIAPPSSIF